MIEQKKRITYLKFLLLEPRANLLQLVAQIGQGRAYQLLLMLILGTLADDVAMAGYPFHLIRN